MQQVVRFAELLTQARAGDSAALTLLAAEYEPQILRVARSQLGPKLRPFLDSVDLVQSVHRSLLMGLRDARFDVISPEHLISLAVTIIRRKVARQWRHLRRQQRIEDLDGTDLERLLVSLTTADPLEIAALRDQTAVLFGEMKETERTLIELRLDGYTTAEISQRLGCDKDVVRVRLHRLRGRLKSLGLMIDWM